MAEPQTTPAVDPAAAFACMYPRLRLVKELDDFVDIYVDGAAEDLIAGGFLTRENLAALPPCGRKNFYVCDKDRDCSSKVSRVRAGLRVNMWGYGGPMYALRRKLGIKVIAAEAVPADDAEPLSSAADLKAVQDLIDKFAAVASRLLPSQKLRLEIGRKLGGIDSLLLGERERVAEAKSKARPAYLRLVVDNDDAVSP